MEQLILHLTSPEPSHTIAKGYFPFWYGLIFIALQIHENVMSLKLSVLQLSTIEILLISHTQTYHQFIHT